MSRIQIAVAFFVLLWFGVKIAFLVNGEAANGFHAGVFINMSALILLPYLSLRFYYRKNAEIRSFLDDLKQALRPTVLYAVLITIGIFAYYRYIDPEFTANKYRDAIEVLQESVGDEEQYAKLQKDDIGLQNISREEYLKRSTEGIDFIYSPSVQTGASLLALFLTSIFYSLIITLFYRMLIMKLGRQ